MVSLGRLESVSLRQVWPNESSDFTPWLAANLDVLGQAVGLALELRHREYPVDRFTLDLLLEDAQGRVVIVENQLEQTDHGHLGQLLTYCAGTQAEIVIWIAHSVTEEHAAALEWLNDNTITGVGFFGVEVEAVRIGDSTPAPNFKVVVRPNDWAKHYDLAGLAVRMCKGYLSSAERYPLLGTRKFRRRASDAAIDRLTCSES